MKKSFLLLLSISLAELCLSQTYYTSNGYYLPVRGTYRVLVIYAQVDYANCRMTILDQIAVGPEEPRWHADLRTQDQHLSN